MSAAASASASDSTKVDPSFTVTQVEVTPYDPVNAPQAPFRLTNGQTSAPQVVSITSKWEFSIEIDLAASTGGGRAADHAANISFAGAFTTDGATETVVLVHHGNAAHPEAGGFSAHAGDFTPGGRQANDPAGGNFPSGTIATTCGLTRFHAIEQPVVAGNPELGQPHLQTAVATFRIEQDSIEVFDNNTGRYVFGPTDNFTFNLALQP